MERTSSQESLASDASINSFSSFDDLRNSTTRGSNSSLKRTPRSKTVESLDDALDECESSSKRAQQEATEASDHVTTMRETTHAHTKRIHNLALEYEGARARLDRLLKKTTPFRHHSPNQHAPSSSRDMLARRESLPDPGYESANSSADINSTTDLDGVNSTAANDRDSSSPRNKRYLKKKISYGYINTGVKQTFGAVELTVRRTSTVTTTVVDVPE